MIVTLTPNPSIDATLALGQELDPGAVNRASEISYIAGGKGINVSRTLHLAGVNTLALFPAARKDPFVMLMAGTGVPYEALTPEHPTQVRTNATLTDAAGETTKINGPGQPLTAADVEALLQRADDALDDADAIVMAGSLPPGVPEDFYVRAVDSLHAHHPDTLIAVDTSDHALRALTALRDVEHPSPILLAPNSAELGQIVSCDGEALEQSALAGDLGPVCAAAHRVRDCGATEVLVTLGEAGALLLADEGCWHAAGPAVEVHSTVGAGDACLAGYLMERARGSAPTVCLRTAVAYGSAATALPGTILPGPDDIHAEHATVVAV